jgi:hypothetical protein
VFDTTGGPYPTELTPEGFRSYHNGIPHGTKLSDAVRVEPTRDWPTSTSRNYKGARTPETFAKTGRNAMTNSLADAVEIGPPRTDSGPPAQDSGSTGGSRAEWYTPQAQLSEHTEFEMTPTGRRKAKSGGQSHSLGLADQVTTQSWATPTGDDANNATRASGQYQSLTRQAGKLNPSWVETLMSFPIGWSQLPTKFVKPKGAK